MSNGQEDDDPSGRQFIMFRLAPSIILLAISLYACVGLFNIRHSDDMDDLLKAYILLFVGFGAFCAGVGVLFRPWFIGALIAIAVGFFLAWLIVCGGVAISLFR